MVGGKKAQFRVYMTVIIVLLIFGFLTIVSHLIYQTFLDAYITSGFYTGEVKQVGDDFMTALRGYDLLIVLLLIGLILGVGITSFRIATAPVFFVITLIMGFLLGLISFFFNYVFSELVSPSAFTATLLFFPRTLLICTNLHWVMLISIIVGSITLYAKKPKGQFLS